MSAPSEFGPPPQQSGGGKTVLKIVLIVLAVLVIGCGGLCAGCIFIAGKAGIAIQAKLQEELQTMQLSPAYIDAFHDVQSNDEVVQRLGEPITGDEGLQPFKREGEGELDATGETIQFDIKGPKGRGIVSVVATGDTDGVYRPTKITVTFEDGSVVDVPPPVIKPKAEDDRGEAEPINKS